MDQDRDLGLTKGTWFFLCTNGKFSCTFDFEIDCWLKIPNPTIPHMSIITAVGTESRCGLQDIIHLQSY
jgi:hypothetical protein